MNLIESLFFITDTLEYPNHWAGDNAKKKHFDGSKRLIEAVVEAPESEFDLKEKATDDHRFDASIIPEAFKERAHECAEFAIAGGHKLLVVRFDKFKPCDACEGECPTHFIEGVAVYWDRKKIGEMKVKDFWNYVITAKEMQSGTISNEALWKAEVLPFCNQLKTVYENWSAKLHADLEAKNKKKPTPDEI
jgi:ferredoxin